MKAAGRYDPFKNEIIINRKISPYCFATLNTLLHEFRHMKQRWAIFGAFALYLIIDIGSWAIDRFFYRDILLGMIIPVVSTLAIIYGYLYFESDARGYARRSLSEVLFFLTALDFAILAHEVQAGRRTVRANLKRLHAVMGRHFPFLL
ncbi:MAG: hypothetical protein ACFFER_15970 [Candidatus Thorarchaeota archaeon]